MAVPMNYCYNYYNYLEDYLDVRNYCFCYYGDCVSSLAELSEVFVTRAVLCMMTG